MTSAHVQQQTIHLAWHFPEHEPRHSDPHYVDFERVRARLKAAGLLRCVVCGTDQQVQLHHSHVEYALQNGIALPKLNAALGLQLDDASFGAFIDSPANLEPLCLSHHIGAEGIHLLPASVWELLRIWKDDLPPPVEALSAAQLAA